MLSKNIKDTNKIAKVFLDKLLKDKKNKNKTLIIGLSGDLGSGKTVFTKLIAKHLGIKDRVFSPTYVIMKKYPVNKIKGYKFFFHLDAYRLESEKELLNLGWEEIINNKEHLIFIEWPENVMKIMPENSKFVFIRNDKNDGRDFEFKF